MSSGLISPRTTRSLYAVIDLLRPQNHNETPIYGTVSHCSTIGGCFSQPSPLLPRHLTHQSVDHLISHGNVDQAVHATTGWSKSVRIPTPVQLIYGARQSSADKDRHYGHHYSHLLCDDDDDDESSVDNRSIAYLADRTNGHAYATMLRPSLVCLSVCDVCIVAKRCALSKSYYWVTAYRKLYARNRLVPK